VNQQLEARNMGWRTSQCCRSILVPRESTISPRVLATVLRRELPPRIERPATARLRARPPPASNAGVVLIGRRAGVHRVMRFLPPLRRSPERTAQADVALPMEGRDWLSSRRIGGTRYRRRLISECLWRTGRVGRQAAVSCTAVVVPMLRAAIMREEGAPATGAVMANMAPAGERDWPARPEVSSPWAHWVVQPVGPVLVFLHAAPPCGRP
jgi:hypothetical protein